MSDSGRLTSSERRANRRYALKKAIDSANKNNVHGRARNVQLRKAIRDQSKIDISYNRGIDRSNRYKQLKAINKSESDVIISGVIKQMLAETAVTYLSSIDSNAARYGQTVASGMALGILIRDIRDYSILKEYRTKNY